MSNPKVNSYEAKIKSLPKLLVDKAYEMLTSGEKLQLVN